MAIRNRSRSWRKAAAEAKVIAERTQDAGAKQIMLEIAERYEALATYAECAAATNAECPAEKDRDGCAGSGGR